MDINGGVPRGSIEEKLQTYFQISSNQKPSRMRMSSTIKTTSYTDLKEQWMEHEKASSQFSEQYQKASWTNIQTKDHSFLKLKTQLIENILKKCTLCENRCEVNRTKDIGFCGVKKPTIASEFIHMNEEFVLVPSHTIFFSGCNFKCVYCQNWDISQKPSTGMDIEPEKLAKIIDLRRIQGSKNVNFVGGDPTPNIAYIFNVMKHTKENIPIVWNSNFYMSNEVMNLLHGFVDLYLTDFKYGNDKCAKNLSGISNYLEVVGQNHKIACKSADMIIRHLVLPNHVECCSKPVIKWIHDHLGSDVVLNIMSQYRPEYKASEHEDIAVIPTMEEVKEVVLFAEGLGFKNLI